MNSLKEKTDYVCCACGSSRLKLIGPCRPYSPQILASMGLDSIDPGSLWQCRDCGLGQRIPRLDDATLVRLYKEAPETTMDYPFEQNAAWVGAREQLVNYFPKSDPISVLDIGCHTGKFLDALPSSWLRYGIESGDEPVQVAMDRGIQIIGSRIEALGREWEHQFDAVTMFDVLEHLSNPLEGIKKAASLLKPGGKLLISTGELDAWTWKWLKGNHWYLQTPQHLCVASKSFFQHSAQANEVSLDSYHRIPHQLDSPENKRKDFIELCYYGARLRGGFWRIPQKVLHSLPEWRYLHHRTGVPWGLKLSDHVLVTFTA